MDKTKRQIAKEAIAAAIALGLMTDEEAQKMIAEADAAALRSLSPEDATQVLKGTEQVQGMMKRQKVGPIISRQIVAAVGRFVEEGMSGNGKQRTAPVHNK